MKILSPYYQHEYHSLNPNKKPDRTFHDFEVSKFVGLPFSNNMKKFQGFKVFEMFCQEIEIAREVYFGKTWFPSSTLKKGCFGFE